MSAFKDRTNNTYGILTVKEKTDERSHNGSVIWRCECECGNTVFISGDRLKSHKSCGCLSKENSSNFGERMRKHSESKTRLYNIWCRMKDRCNNKNNKRYKDYGGRGIKVCKEWEQSYELFSEWAKHNGYAENLTIDRINVNGDYKPSNCRWITSKEQALNKRSNHIITFKGKTMTMKEWSKELDISYGCLQTRLQRNWSVEKALTTPKVSYKKE